MEKNRTLTLYSPPHPVHPVILSNPLLMHFRRLLLPLLLIACSQAHAQSWHETLMREMPLLGHRNWIVVADSAYPLQNAAGIEVVATGLSQTDLLAAVLDALSKTRHVRPVFFTDAELPFVAEQDANGISAYRAQLSSLLKGGPVSSLEHEQILAKMQDAANSYHVLVLKSTATMAYTSVFIQLYCGYWPDDAEKRLRAAMSAAGQAKQP